MELSVHTQSAVDGLHGMICNSPLFFDRIVEMMIIVCAELPDMNPVDVLHYLEKFELHIACSRQLQRTRVPAEQWLRSRSREEATQNQRAVRGQRDDCAAPSFSSLILNLLIVRLIISIEKNFTFSRNLNRVQLDVLR